MIGLPTPLLSRLRRHRGLWALAMAVLLIKLIGGSICLADAPSPAIAATSQTAAMVAIVDAVSSSDDGCLLGEGAGCHCTCLHSVAMPVSATLAILPFAPRLDLPAVYFGIVPAAPGSLLRPPIA
ncbi:MAG TPA: hypothetical protein VIM98_02895 [Dyella sp.]|uniref:hypothetical protein n=1 Tax=Dyella sp. TaxID=1869338 RepID=UPI002F931F64